MEAGDQYGLHADGRWEFNGDFIPEDQVPQWIKDEMAEVDELYEGMPDTSGLSRELQSLVRRGWLSRFRALTRDDLMEMLRVNRGEPTELETLRARVSELEAENEDLWDSAEVLSRCECDTLNDEQPPWCPVHGRSGAVQTCRPP